MLKNEIKVDRNDVARALLISCSGYHEHHLAISQVPTSYK